MGKLEPFLARRSELAKRYNEQLQSLEEQGFINRPVVDRDAKSGWHIYVLQINPDKLGADRRIVFEALRSENIGVNVHYIPVHIQPYYRNLGYQPGICPIWSGSTKLSLPFHSIRECQTKMQMTSSGQSRK
jgi:perosamine synthetase